MMKLSLKMPKKHQNDFLKEWILFFVGFLENPTQEELNQVMYNLWNKMPKDTSSLFKELEAQHLVEEKGDTWILGKKQQFEKEFLNFNTVSADPAVNNLKDLWEIGDSLVPMIAIKDIPRVLEEMCNIRSEKYSFSTTSFAKNYIVRIYNEDSDGFFYTRFFK